MRPHPSPPATAALLLGALLMLPACGAPADLNPTPGGPLPTTPAGSGAPTGGQPTLPTAPATPTGADAAVDCGGEPDQDQLLAVLYAEDVLEQESEVTVEEGPLCADDWQFAVIAVPDRDPLQVVTSGPAGDLRLVTVGTDVCTIEVRVNAPHGIRAAAGCVG